MSQKRRKVVAKGVLCLYVFISATFSFSHRDFIPLDGTRILTPTDNSGFYLDTDGGTFVCPAHLFAQSTTSADPQTHNFISPRRFSFLRIVEHPRFLARPHVAASSRAPPAA